MDQAANHEKRSHPRYPVRGQLTGNVLSALLSPLPGSEVPFQWTIQDISQGGFGVLTPSTVSVMTPIRCEVQLDDMPVSIPTLVQVCWTERNSSGEGARVGLHFLL
ncbi:MAG: PilZ domain-containing protein [Acidobacteria bacterium]|nr:PilZ domain-containing protein [Acidobacteriota bacterium]